MENRQSPTTSTNQNASLSTNISGDEEQIQKILDAWADAFCKADIETILNFYSPDVVAFDMMPPLSFNGKMEYENAWRAAAKSSKAPWIFKAQDRKIYVGGDIAFTHCLAECGGTMDGKTQSGFVRLTQGFKRFGDKWLIVHDQYSVPVDMESGKALMDLKPGEPAKH
jgi:ketosteroid isomerase-like protein